MPRAILLASLVSVLLTGKTSAAIGSCEFSDSSLSFNGTPAQQAACLLRDVRRFGKVDKTSKALDPSFSSLINGAISVEKGSLLKYLQSSGIAETDIGGSIANPLSHAGSGDSKMPEVIYFVIHDVSSPNYAKNSFPDDINEASWSGNDLVRWQHDTGAHVYVNRVGQSTTARDLSIPWRATKFEVDLGVRSKGLFVHVELIQPRKSASPGPIGNDAVAPEPGFTKAQLQRLAVVYVAASVRRRRWLVPAFHAVLDEGIPDGHDDPQNFATNAWISEVLSLVSTIQHQK
jgi:hypothetical protein